MLCLVVSRSSRHAIVYFGFEKASGNRARQKDRDFLPTLIDALRVPEIALQGLLSAVILF